MPSLSRTVIIYSKYDRSYKVTCFIHSSKSLEDLLRNRNDSNASTRKKIHSLPLGSLHFCGEKTDKKCNITTTKKL